MDHVDIDLERQRKAKVYARLNRRLWLIDLLFGGLYVLAWLIFGWSSALKTSLLAYSANDWFLVAGFGFVFGGLYILVDLPLSYYGSFLLPHRFELSNQTRRGWVSDQLKGLLLGIILGGGLLEIVYAVLRAAPQTWWLWAAAILLLFNVILSNLAPILLLPIFYKFIPLDEEYADLSDRLVRLAEQAGTHVRGVYQFDMSRRTKQANAALTGLGNTRRIILGDTLLSEFTPDEIETVLAHELGHHVHKDIPLGIIIESAITLIGLYLASVGLKWGVSTFGFASPGDIAGLPIFALVIGIFGIVTSPLTNAYSRWRERLADAYALSATGKAKAFASAMTRLANQNLSEVDPEPWVEWLLYSHPALNKRIRMAETWKP